MNNELIKQKSWLNRNWKWLIPCTGIILISMVVFFSSSLGGVTTDLIQAYTDTKLYENALEKVKSDKRVTEILGEIEPIDKSAILEGSVKYSADNKTVNTSIRLTGTKGKAKMDIIADQVDGQWDYKKINLRIRKPVEKQQTIEIIALQQVATTITNVWQVN